MTAPLALFRHNVWVERSRDEPARNALLGPRLLQAEEGGVLHAELCRLCDEAQETIMLCSFLLADRELEAALVRAALRGVRVYLLTASETRLEKDLAEGQDFDRRTMDAHKRLLDELAGRVLVRSAEHLHAKFLMVDVTQSARRRGVVLTSNLTHEALKRNWELAAFLPAEAVAPLWRLFTWAFWEQAQKELLVASFGFGYDDVMKALIERARARLSVTVLTRPRPSVVKDVCEQRKAGATVYGVPYLHGKALWQAQQRRLVPAEKRPGVLLDRESLQARCWKEHTHEFQHLARVARQEFGSYEAAAAALKTSDKTLRSASKRR